MPLSLMRYWGKKCLNGDKAMGPRAVTVFQETRLMQEPCARVRRRLIIVRHSFGDGSLPDDNQQVPTSRRAGHIGRA